MKYYAVIKGREGPKIYTTWEECNQNITGYSGAIFKSFRTEKEALRFLTENNCEAENIFGEEQGKTQSHKKKVIILKKENPLLQVEKVLLDYFFLNSDKIIVYTDGSCTNQGTTNAKAGSGIYFPQFKIKHSSKVIGNQTNNRGELFAVILALRFLTETYQKYYILTNHKIEIEVHLDSTYVIKGLNKNENKANLDLWTVLLKLLQDSKEYFKIEWIKELAHSGIEGNEIADQLAKVFAFE